MIVDTVATFRVTEAAIIVVAKNSHCDKQGFLKHLFTSPAESVIIIDGSKGDAINSSVT